MALKDPVVGIAVYQFGVAAVLWFKKRKRWGSEPDLSLLATRIRARWPIHKPLFISEVSCTRQTRGLGHRFNLPISIFISVFQVLLSTPSGFPFVYYFFFMAWI